MGNLFAELARQATANARREVETYLREIPEFAFLGTDQRARDRTMEYSLWFRRRTIELAPDNSELNPDDLDYIASIGELRAAAGMSLDSRRRVLRVHTALMLREINEATDAERGGGVEELMRMMSWFAPQGERGIGAYRRGFVAVLRRRMPYVEQVALLARSLLTGDPMADELAPVLDLRLAGHWAVTVLRVPDRPAGDRDLESEIEALVKAHQVPVVWCPEAGSRAGELIAVTPCAGGDAGWRAAGGDAGWRAAGGGGDEPTADGDPGQPAADGGGGQPATDGDPGQPAADGGGGRPPADGDPGPPPAGPPSVPAAVADLVRDFADALGRPCAAGTVTAPRSELPDALERARRISKTAPLRRPSARLRPHTMPDLFVELAVAEVPFVDAWLHTVAQRLDSGPDLVVTLDAYYRHDMNRSAAATALNVHPRTLDYRLRRVRELTGIDPGSTSGVRTLSSAVTRRLSGAWGGGGT
ncbi:PucR family transcriptional regulator [Streptomyces blattellae]|uniref:PucR family transcriptional regulator n=1 Tax=Streptomyces blattellae TaxID=2569855 RepID=UPI001E2E3195|nr:helix-turn-helix domain-containing protein [Streptomyces blattellae]